MSKLDETIEKVSRKMEKDNRVGYSHTSVAVKDLRVLLEWIGKVREDNSFLVGDRVKLPVTGDPEDGEQPETGVVIGFAGGGALLIRPETGEYSDTKTGLWYEGTTVERIDD